MLNTGTLVGKNWGVRKFFDSNMLLVHSVSTFHLMNNIFSGVIGYAEVFGFWWNINSQADGTDLISLFGVYLALNVKISVDPHYFW